MSELLNKQLLFMECLGKLIAWALTQGYKVKGEQLKRTVEEAAANAASGAGIYHSLHLLSLAIDLDFFKDGVFLTTVDEIRPLGEFWKSLDPLCCWGGDFSRPDADHFSITHQGVK